ncbi:MAG: DUF3618 domain-containing protein [Polyangiales bacterium]
MTQGTAPDKTAAIRSDIAQTRDDMSKTINQIEERLSPAHLKEQLADVKQAALGQYHEAKDHVKEDLSRELEMAKAKVQEEVHAAKLAVQQELHHARMALRDATVGKVENMVHDARDAVSDAGTSILDTIKENPIPSAMLAIGLGWLLLGGKKTSTRRAQTRGSIRNARLDHDDGYGDRGYDGAYGERSLVERGRGAIGGAMRTAGDGVSGVAHRIQDGASSVANRAGAVMHDVEDSVGSVASRATEGAAHLARDARDEAMYLARGAGRAGRMAMRRAQMGAHRVEEGFEATMRDNPLAVGAVAVALGAAVGLVLPHTDREDQLMGDAKQRLVDRAQGIAHEALGKVGEAVETAATKADEKMKQVASSATGTGTTPNGSTNGGRNSSAQI